MSNKLIINIKLVIAYLPCILDCGWLVSISLYSDPVSSVGNNLKEKKSLLKDSL